ncbi:ATP-binding protein [Caulobacter sp. 73W]|uniref:ATP-binding protein n=1 Tax=Caulobacter sp. 73W TaxID=3161137 RepID=A0AB39KRG6_9CAUL
MTYKKVFSSSRYQAKGQNSFAIDPRQKRLTIGARTPTPSKSAYIGKVVEQGKVSNILDYEVHCDVSFPHVIGIFGSRGSGKSFDLGVFLEGIFDHADGTPIRDAGIVFDIQDQFWTLAFEPQTTIRGDAQQLSELTAWGLTPSSTTGLRVLVPAGSDTPVPQAQPFRLSPSQLSAADWLAILELDRFSAMGQALLGLIEAEGAQTPSELVQLVDSSPSLANFQQGTVDGLRWRLDSLAKAEIIGSAGLVIDELLAPGALSIVLMRNLPESVRGLVVGVISRLVADRMGRAQQLRKVAMRTGNAADDSADLATRLWMVLDEAHVLVPSDGSTAATAPLIDYVKRGRDAGLSLIFATQQPSAVDTKLMSQVDLTITHTLGFEADLNAAVARMPTRTTVEYDVDNQRASYLTDVLRSLSPGEAIVADGSSGRVFIAKIRPRRSAHGGVSPQ